MNILLIEDNKVMSKSLKYSLETNNYKVIAFETIKETKEYLNTKPEIDLAILDINLPDGTGYELYEHTIKKSQIPTIFLTARDDENDIVKGLMIGAEDYLTKPFSTKELLARIRVVTRNRENSSDKQIYFENEIKLDLTTKKVFINQKEISLTKTEFLILEYFMKNRAISCSREKILTGVWGYDFDGEEKIVDVYINSLRKKMDTENKYIHTIRGFGYIFQYKED